MRIPRLSPIIFRTSSLSGLLRLPLISKIQRYKMSTLPSQPAEQSEPQPEPLPKFSSNWSSDSNPSSELSPLLKAHGGRWNLLSNGLGIDRKFKFRDFDTCWEFMNHIASKSKEINHHPEWDNVYNTTRIRWTTHSPKGISKKDVRMARICDEAAERMGEVVKGSQEG